MQVQYHLNPITWIPELCPQTHRQPCPLAALTHYATFEEAQAAAHQTLLDMNADWQAQEAAQAAVATRRFYEPQELATLYEDSVEANATLLATGFDAQVLGLAVAGNVFRSSSDRRDYVDALLVSPRLPADLRADLLAHPGDYTYQSLLAFAKNPTLTLAERLRLIDLPKPNYHGPQDGKNMYRQFRHYLSFISRFLLNLHLTADAQNQLLEALATGNPEHLPEAVALLAEYDPHWDDNPELQRMAADVAAYEDENGERRDSEEDFDAFQWTQYEAAELSSEFDDTPLS